MNNKSISLGSIIGLIVAVIFFWVFAINIWFSNTILDRENFVNTTTQVLTTEASRNAIAEEVVTIVQKNAPIIGTITSPIITKIVVGVLDTNLFLTIYTKLSEEIYFQLTTPNPSALEIELGEVASFIGPLILDQNPEFLNNFPNKITIIGKNEIPSLYKFSNYLSILGPILFISGLAIVGLIWRRSIDKRNYFISLGLITATSGFLVFALIPVVGNLITSGLSSPNSIFIITSLYSTFTKTLVDFSVAVLVIGLFSAFAAKFVRRSVFRLPVKK